MAKIIKITPECLQEIKRDFEKLLEDAKLADGKISFTKSFSTIKREATVWFTEIAWNKMQALVKEFDKEVAWHGLACRGPDPEKDEYVISDILVYPQEVTGATVNTDQEKYQSWLMGHEDDVFNNIRMQGHSHVNMGVTPSTVDNSLYERILDQLDDTMFYIFLIYNKRGDKTYKIYDLAKNVLFETGDVTVKVMQDTSNPTGVRQDGMTDDEFQAVLKFLRDLRGKQALTQYIADAKSMVKEKQYTYSYGGGSGTAYTPYSGIPGYNSGAYARNETAASKPAAAAGSQPAKAETKAQPAKKETKTESSKATQSAKKDEKQDGGGKKKRKGKRTKVTFMDDYTDDDPYGNLEYGLYGLFSSR